jgi:hypothetical protein
LLLVEQIEIILAAFLKLPQQCFYLFLYAFIVALELALIVPVYPQEKLIFYVFLEGFDDDAMPCRQSQHHPNILLR